MVGEFHCLNCARHLADLIRAEDGRMRLDHPSGQASRPMLVTWLRGPRCAACGGRAVLDQPLGVERRAAPAAA